MKIFQSSVHSAHSIKLFKFEVYFSFYDVVKLMEYAIIVIFLFFILVHGFTVYILVKMMLSSVDQSVLNKVHVCLSFAVIFPFFMGDIVILASYLNTTVDAYLCAALADFCGGSTYQNIFQHYFQYRSSSLYKGIAHRFYEFAIASITIKALLTQASYTFFLVFVIMWDYNFQAFGTIFQIVVSITNVLFHTLLMHKLMSLDLGSKDRGWKSVRVSRRSLQSDEKQNDPSVQSSPKPTFTISSNDRNDIFNRVKQDIHKSIVRALVAGLVYILLAVVLLGVFSDNSPRSGYITSISYRVVMSPAILMTNVPVWKAYKEKQKLHLSTASQVYTMDTSQRNANMLLGPGHVARRPPSDELLDDT